MPEEDQANGIARRAEVPLGNVYYYFKTKDDIIAAVVDAHIKAIAQEIGSLERHRTPAARLKALITTLARQADAISHFGCPHGTLCAELGKQNPPGSQASGSLLQLPLEWAEQSFMRMGRRDAKDLAIDLIAAYHGTAALTQAWAGLNSWSARPGASADGSTISLGPDPPHVAQHPD
jgi:TetR/AcrR family transcriptional regulator, transcriptional repressor for nem operon